MRIGPFVSFILTTFLLLDAQDGNAVEFSFSGPSSATVEVGDLFTIDLLVTNLREDSVALVAASAYDYSGVATFVTGDAVSSIFNIVCLSPPTGCVGGIANLAATPLVESALSGEGDRVQFLQAITATIVTSPGAGIDQGLDGQVGTTMFSLTFEAVASGEILIGTGYPGDDVIIRPTEFVVIPSLAFTVNVIPEPGTALLMGLGLTGLAAFRRDPERECSASRSAAPRRRGGDVRCRRDSRPV